MRWPAFEGRSGTYHLVGLLPHGLVKIVGSCFEPAVGPSLDKLMEKGEHQGQDAWRRLVLELEDRPV